MPPVVTAHADLARLAELEPCVAAQVPKGLGGLQILNAPSDGRKKSGEIIIYGQSSQSECVFIEISNNPIKRRELRA
jgi:hypothetical protein